MSIQITPGMRLKELVERRAIKKAAFADLSGVYPSTLSRYMSGKQPMSDKFIKKAADLLNVTEEYLRCESDDPTPPEYQKWNEKESNDMLDLSLQRFRFSSMARFLEDMGVQQLIKASVDNAEYALDNHLQWHALDDRTDDPYDVGNGIPNTYMEKELKDNPTAKIWVELSFKNRKVSMNYREYKQWLRGLIAGMELELQKKFEIFYNISLIVLEDEFDRAGKT